MRGIRFALGFLLAIPIAATPAFAHPDLVRHGYANCTACHVSPSGGGSLNAYGRGISQSLLSTWGTEAEAAALYGALPLPETLSIQGTFRGIQFYRDNTRVREARLLRMQSELEIAASFKPRIGTLTAALTAGADSELEFESPRHYLMLLLAEKYSFRAGKFLADFGINLASHHAATRDGIGLGPGDETYNLEAAYQGESVAGALTLVGLLGTDQFSDKGVALTGSYFFSDRYKIGASARVDSHAGVTRTIFGPHAILGFTPALHLLSELDLLIQAGKTGAVTTHRLAYDIVQGVQPYLLLDASSADLQAAGAIRSAWGAGALWNPRPHFEFRLEGQRRATASSLGAETLVFGTFGVYL